MSTRATYGLFLDQYFDIPPSGERVYWAIPIGYATWSQTQTLYSDLRQGESIGNERAVYHAKVVGHINPKPFVVNGRKYATSFHYTQTIDVGWVYGRYIPAQQEMNFQLYEDGARYTVTVVVDDSISFSWHRRESRGEYAWSFNGDRVSNHEFHLFTSEDGGPERETASSSGKFYLSEYWTGETETVSYNWPAIIQGLLDSHPCEVDFDNLIVEAADQMQYSANNLDNIRQFADIASDVVKLLTGHAPKNTVKRILRGTSSPRAFGRELKELSQSAWLTNRYVINTTKSDVEDFLDKVGSIDLPECKNEHIVRAGSMQGNWMGHVKIRMRDRKQNALAETHRWAMQHGLGVTPANLWDMIPFSFMVDWFIPIGETLNAIDAEFFFHSAYYEILSYTASRKFTMDVKDNGNTFHVSVYWREVSDRVPIISSLTYEDPSTRTIRNRVIDASAIFL